MKTHFEILDYAAIMDISRRDKERRERRYTHHIARQNFAARYGYRLWNRIFNLF